VFCEVCVGAGMSEREREWLWVCSWEKAFVFCEVCAVWKREREWMIVNVFTCCCKIVWKR
jgi:hypothetical protein